LYPVTPALADATQVTSTPCAVAVWLRDRRGIAIKPNKTTKRNKPMNVRRIASSEFGCQLSAIDFPRLAFSPASTG
jgi:hypothetical protein